jgi:hypothetical protein
MFIVPIFILQSNSWWELNQISNCSKMSRSLWNGSSTQILFFSSSQRAETWRGEKGLIGSFTHGIWKNAKISFVSGKQNTSSQGNPHTKGAMAGKRMLHIRYHEFLAFRSVKNNALWINLEVHWIDDYAVISRHISVFQRHSDSIQHFSDIQLPTEGRFSASPHIYSFYRYSVTWIPCHPLLAIISVVHSQERNRIYILFCSVTMMIFAFRSDRFIRLFTSKLSVHNRSSDTNLEGIVLSEMQTHDIFLLERNQIFERWCYNLRTNLHWNVWNQFYHQEEKKHRKKWNAATVFSNWTKLVNRNWRPKLKWQQKSTVKMIIIRSSQIKGLEWFWYVSTKSFFKILKRHNVETMVFSKSFTIQLVLKSLRSCAWLCLWFCDFVVDQTTETIWLWSWQTQHWFIKCWTKWHFHSEFRIENREFNHHWTPIHGRKSNWNGWLEF